jgi:Rrf2 family protein
MLLSAKAEYAVMAMLELATHYGDHRPVALTEVADAYGIPQRFLVQIFVVLKKAKLVATTRGPQGGYQLIKDPNTVTVADVVELFDSFHPEDTLRAGLVENPTAAALRETLNQAIGAMRSKLAGATLGELVRAGHGLEYVI